MDTTDTTTRTVTLVTGANKGLGLETARRLLAAGHVVLVGSRDEARGAAAAKELGGDSVALGLDVTDQASVDAAAAHVRETYGRLDVLVNNAGITGGDASPPSTTDLDRMRAAYETNVFGVVRVTNAFLPLLRESAAPRIVNVSSTVGSLALAPGFAEHLPPMLAYPSSKTALNGVTVQYANELRGAGVTVVAVSPGYCATDLNDHRGFASAADGGAAIARVVLGEVDVATGGFVDEQGRAVAW